MVEAQLAERSLLIPEVRSFDPAVNIFYAEHLLTVNCIEKTNINRKMQAGNGPLKTEALKMNMNTWFNPSVQLLRLPRC